MNLSLGDLPVNFPVLTTNAPLLARKLSPRLIDISIKDDIAVLSIGSKGIALYDVSDIQNPKAKGIFDVGYTYKTEFWNGHILICTRSGLKTAKINI